MNRLDKLVSPSPLERAPMASAIGGGGGSGAGGSGYIGGVSSSSTYGVIRHMYGYQVPTSDDEATKTITGTCASQSPQADCAKIGNGYARITYLGE